MGVSVKPRLAWLIVAVWLAGCEAVVSTRPLTAEPTPLDQDRFEGVWLPSDGGEAFSVRFGCDGVARFAAMEWSKEQFRLVRGEAIVAEGKRGASRPRFLSLRFEDDGKWTDYYVVRYHFTFDGDMVLWLPNARTFEDAIRSGRLQGAINRDGGARITSAPDALLDFLDRPDNLSLFAYEQPLVYRKIASVRGREPATRCEAK